MGTSSNWQNNCTSTHFICNASDRHSFTSPFIHPWLSPLWLLSRRIHNTCFVIIPSALHNRTLKQWWVKRWKENGDLPREKEEEDNDGKVEDIRGGPWWEWKARGGGEGGGGLGTRVYLTKFFRNKRQSDCHRRLFKSTGTTPHPHRSPEQPPLLPSRNTCSFVKEFKFTTSFSLKPLG